MTTSSVTPAAPTSNGAETNLTNLPADKQRHLAQDMARAEPDLSGPALAARFNKSERWGRNQRAAARAGTAHTGTPAHQAGTAAMPAPENRTAASGTVPPAPARLENTGKRHDTEASGGTATGTDPGTQNATAAAAHTPEASMTEAGTADLTRGWMNGTHHQFPGIARETGAEATQTAPERSQAATKPANETDSPTAEPAARGAVAMDRHSNEDRAALTAQGQNRHEDTGTGTGQDRHEDTGTGTGIGQDRHGDAGTPAHRHGTPTVPAGRHELGHTGTSTAVTDNQSDPLLLSVLILAAMAAAMAWSWQHLAHLAVMAGATHGEFAFGPGMEWLLPISVDVLLVAGAWKARRLHSSGRRPGRATWTALAGAAAMSLGGNVISTLDMAGLTPPIDEWPPAAAVAVVVTVGLWMPAAAIVALEVLRDQGRAAASTAPDPHQPNQ